MNNAAGFHFGLILSSTTDGATLEATDLSIFDYRVVSETLSKYWDFLVALSAPLMTRLLRLPNITTTIFLFFDRKSIRSN